MSKYEIIKTEFGEMLTETDNDGRIWFISQTEDNSRYQAYLRWVENPNTPEFQTPWVEPQLTKE